MVTLGADPELFILDGEAQPLPSVGLFGGTKGNPLPMEGLPEGFGIQEDNVMVEFNIPPAQSTREFRSNIRRGLDWVCDFVHTKLGEGYMVHVRPELKFSPHHLESEQARTFGCSADFSGYLPGKRLPAPRIAEGMRYAGGHIHIGYDNPDDIPIEIIAQLCDVYMGLPCVGFDAQASRRRAYGTPGRYRPTDYGIEYRALSNRWVSSRNRSEAVGNFAGALGWAIENRPKMLYHLYQAVPWSTVKKAIMTEDSPLASRVLNFLNEETGINFLEGRHHV